MVDMVSPDQELKVETINPGMPKSENIMMVIEIQSMTEKEMWKQHMQKLRDLYCRNRSGNKGKSTTKY